MPRVLAPNTGRRGRAEFAIAALAVLAVLALLVPVLRRTYQASLIVRCREQLQRIFAAVRNYALNCDGYPPCGDAADPARGWQERVGPFLEPSAPAAPGAPGRLWRCPAGGDYVANAGLWRAPLRRLDDFMLSRQVGVAADGGARAGDSGVGDFESIDWRHRSGANVVFLDGHVDWVPLDQAWTIRDHWNRPQ